jgi:hypothetical protein
VFPSHPTETFVSVNDPLCGIGNLGSKKNYLQKYWDGQKIGTVMKNNKLILIGLIKSSMIFLICGSSVKHPPPFLWRFLYFFCESVLLPSVTAIYAQGSHGLEKFWNSEKTFKGLEKVWNSVISLITCGKSLENCHLVKKCTTVVIQEPYRHIIPNSVVGFPAT